MSNVVELSRAGNLADLVAALEDEDIPRLFLHAQWGLEGLAVLQVDQVVSEVASEEDLMADGDEGALEEVSKIVEVMGVVEEVLDTKDGVATDEEIVVGMVGQMDMVLPQMLQLVQEVAVADIAEEGMAELVQIETVLRQVVGMIRVVADAHMMTETAVIVAAIEATEIVTEHPVVEAAAIWSR
jgi:hypothetical protein